MHSIAFLYLGGAHQVLHTAPVAAELTRRPGVAVTILVADEASRSMVGRVLDAYGGPDVAVHMLRRPWYGDALARLTGHSRAAKTPLLIAHRNLLNSFDAIVVPERTSIKMRRLGVTGPRLIHFRHGAGDRAPSSELRLNRFDLVVVPGIKDASRAIRQCHVPPERCAITGYVKLDLLSRLRDGRAALFANERPTVVYNAHFDRSESSWDRFARPLIDAFAAQERFNLVVAPHVRLFEDASMRERAAWEALAVPDKIIVDLGSERSLDMSYTLAADIYLGDVSSQLYEFLVEPRPCVFLDAHGVDWRADPRYAGWHLGQVADGVEAAMSAIASARSLQPQFDARQRSALVEAMGADIRGSASRGAAHIVDFINDPPERRAAASSPPPRRLRPRPAHSPLN